MLDRTHEKRPERGFYPRSGIRLARAWAFAYGSAWVTSNDVMEPPGIFTDYKYFQMIQRAMARCDIHLERRHCLGRAYLYRLPPDVVKTLTYGDKK